MASTADKRQLADLSALADGTIDPARREAVEAEIARSPELSALYERERHVVALLHDARATDRAPAALRARIDAARPSRPVRVRRRAIYGGSFAAALAAVGLALALILPAGTPGAPSVSEAAALALRGIAAPPPAADRDGPGLILHQGVGDLYFPNWARAFGWKAVGQRTDRINGRVAVTVYYAWKGHRLAYTIVGSPALEAPNAPTTRLAGTEMRTLMLNGRLVVTWKRDNHTCVLSTATGVPASELHRLAAWRVPVS
jgi:anti-sigma factor RsiW